MALSVGRIFGEIELRDAFTAKLRQVASEVDKAIPKIKTLQDKLEGIGKGMMQGGAAMTAGITAPILGIGYAAIKAGNEFSGAMNRVSAAMPTGDMDALRAAAIKMGKETVFSSTEAAGGLVELGKAGLDSKNAIAALEPVLQLAIAGQMDMASAAALTTNTMATFNLSASDMVRANDTLAKAAASSTIDVRDLAEGMKYVGPLAATAGVSLETVSAAMALLGEAGIKGSMAGTTLRGVMQSLIAPTDKQAGLMKQLGLESAFVDGKMMSVVDILKTLEGQGEKTAQIMALFGQRAGPGMLALLNKGSEGLAEMEKKLDDVGFAARQAEALMKGLPGALEKLKGSVDTAFQALGTMLEPAVIAVAKALEIVADIISGVVIPLFDKLPGPIKAVIGVIVLLAAAAGPLLLALGGLTLGWSAMLPVMKTAQITLAAFGVTQKATTAGMWLMNGAQKALGVSGWAMLGPFTAIVAALVAINAALPLAIDGIKKMWSAIMSGDFSEIKKRDHNTWMGRFLGLDDESRFGATGKTGLEDGRSWKAGAKDIELKPERFKIPTVATNSATAFADALKEANDEIEKMAKTAPVKFKDLSNAIKDGSFSMEQLTETSGLSEMAVNILSDRIKKTTESTKEHQKELDKANEAAKQLIKTYTGADKIEAAAKALKGVSDSMKIGIPLAKMTREQQDAIHQTMSDAKDVYKAWGKEVPEDIWAVYRATLNFTDTIPLINRYGEQIQEASRDYIPLINSQEKLAKSNAWPNVIHDLARFGPLNNKITVDLEKQNQRIIEGARRMRDLGNAIMDVGDALGDTFAGSAVTAIGRMVDAWGRAKEAAVAYATASIAAQRGMIAQEALVGAANTIASTSQGTTGQRAMGGMMSGASAGMGIGMMVGGPMGAAYGAAIGGGAGLVMGLVRGATAATEFQKAVKELPGGLAALAAQSRMLGIAMNHPVTNMRELTRAQADIQAVTDMMARYELSWKDLGDTARQANIDGMTRTLLADFKMLERQGVDALSKMSKGFSQLVVDAVSSGTKIPVALQPMLESLIRSKSLSEEAMRALLGMGTEATPSLEDAAGAAERLGIKLDDVGGKIPQLKISAQAEQMARDFDTLINGMGADADHVLGLAKSKVQELVTAALTGGLVLPESMRPWLEKMVEAGMLVDGTGRKLTDLSGLTFQVPLSQKIDELITKLGDLIDAFSNVGTAAEAGFRRARGAAESLGTAIPRGSAVAPADPTEGGGRSDGRSATINVKVDGRTIARATVPHIPDVLDVMAS
jgi:TP901 family phage tail tape measure protein